MSPSLDVSRPTPFRTWHQQTCTLRSDSGSLAVLTPEDLRASIEEVCAIVGLQLTQSLEHHFQPQGASLVLLGPQLRLALHTWPERGLATLDVLAPQSELLGLVVEGVAQRLGCAAHELRTFNRRGEDGADEGRIPSRSTGT